MSYSDINTLRIWALELLENKELCNENKADRIADAVSFLTRSNAQ